MIAIRLLNGEDVGAYRRLRLEALRETPTAFCSSYEEELAMPLEMFASRIRDNRVFGAFTVEGELIGLVGLVRDGRAKRAHGASLVGMHVAPSHRRRGVGGALLDHAIQFARQSGGVQALKLSVMAGRQDAARLYRSRGFQSYGIEPAALCVDGEYFDEEYMILRLEP